MTRLRLAPPLLLLALACARSPGAEGPVPIAVTPSAGEAAAPQAVDIAGFGFDAHVRADLSGRGGGVDGTFAARLEPAAGGAPTVLSGVALRDARRLAAVIPAGLARGAYRLVITDPRGRTGALEGAYRVVGSNASVASLRVSAPASVRAGIPFSLTVEALDAAGVRVEGADAAVTLSDATGALTPATPGRLAMGLLEARVIIGVLASADRIAAADGAGHSGTSAALDVAAGSAQALAFPDAAVTAAAGACSPPVRLELRDALGHAGVAPAGVSAALQSAPPGVAFYSDAGCAAAAAAVVVIPAGDSSATFRFRSAGAGTVRLRARAAALPSATQDEQVSP